MGTPYLAEIRMVSFNFPPKGWAFCNGQLLPINQNQALFALLGTTYGGDGRVTFGLPDLQGRMPLHFGNGHTMGERGGESAHALSQQELPQHAHPTTFGVADSASPAGAHFARTGKVSFATSPDVTMNPATVSAVGGNQPHENMPPYLTLNFVIALQGIFPSQN